MQRRFGFLLIVSLAAITVAIAARGHADESEKLGLLVIAHGSRSPEWNRRVLEFGQRVAEKAAEDGTFKAVRIAMLEAVKPDVPSAVVELESEGCQRIIAVPLFVAPSGHSHFDVPAVLGIYSSASTRHHLAEEGLRVARPRVPIVLTETLAQGQLLQNAALDQVRKLSKDPSREALVILAHGDPDHHPLVDKLIRQVALYCCGQMGITYADWAYLGVGQQYHSQGLPAIEKALEHRERVLVIGLYVATSAAELHRRALRLDTAGTPADPLAGRDVIFSEETIVGYPGCVDWVLEVAREAAAGLEACGHHSHARSEGAASAGFVQSLVTVQTSRFGEESGRD